MGPWWVPIRNRWALTFRTADTQWFTGELGRDYGVTTRLSGWWFGTGFFHNIWDVVLPS